MIKTVDDAQEKRQRENVAAFFNDLIDPEEQKKQAMQRKEFISTLDQALITSPNLSPKPTKAVKVEMPGGIVSNKKKVEIKVDLGASKLDQSADVK